MHAEVEVDHHSKTMTMIDFAVLQCSNTRRVHDVANCILVPGKNYFGPTLVGLLSFFGGTAQTSCEFLLFLLN